MTEQEHSEFVQWVRDNDPAWQEFAAGSLMPYCHREYDLEPGEEGTVLIAIPLTHMAPLRGLARAGICRARLLAETGHISEALDYCVTVVRAGSHWQRKEITLIEQMFGRSTRQLGCLNLLCMIGQYEISAVDSEMTYQDLQAVYADGYPGIGVEIEKLCFMDIVQRTFTEGGVGGGHIVPHQLALLADGDMPDVMPGSLVHARRDDTVDMMNKLYAVFEQRAGVTPYELRTGGYATWDDTIVEVPRHRYWLFHLMTPALDRASVLSFRGKALYEATLTVLALKRWRLDKGQYPQELTELVAEGYLEIPPDDPYAEGTLTYERRGEEFVLYSLGADFDDDGGVDSSWGEDEGGDQVFWPVR